MGLNKKVSSTVDTVTPKEQDKIVTDVDSGATAAISRLSMAKVKDTGSPAKNYGGRDFEKEARGKTRCVQFEAALMSPAIAGLPFKNMSEYLALVKEAADAGLAYSFEEDTK